MDKAVSHGLRFRKEVVVDGDEIQASIADSFASFAYGAYRIIKLGRPYYRVVGSQPTETGGKITNTINETIDASVFVRWRKDDTYRPANLADWARRYGVSMETVAGTVRADQPTVTVIDPPAPDVTAQTMPAPTPPPVA